MKTTTYYALVYNGQVWGAGDSPEEARAQAHADSQRLREETADGPPESMEEDHVIRDGVLVTMSCDFNRREALADAINGWK